MRVHGRSLRGGPAAPEALAGASICFLCFGAVCLALVQVRLLVLLL